jgi:hypothetical protein
MLGFQVHKTCGGTRWKWLVFNVIRTLACIITITTLGFVSIDWDTRLLFSEWIDK